MTQQDSWMDDLPAEAVADLESAAEKRTFAGGQIIFRKGDRLHGIYTVRSGLVEMRRGFLGNEQLIVGLVRPRTSIGLIGVFSKHGATNTAVAREKTIVDFVPKARFMDLAMKHRELYPALLDKVGDLVFLAMHWIDFSFSATAAEKVVWSLRHLTRFAEPETAGFITLQISQQEFGDSLGISRQSANRELQILASNNVLRIQYGKVQVNAARLAEYSPQETH